MSTKMKTALIVVALLAGIAAFNYFIQMDPSQLAARGVGQDPHSHGDDHDEDAHEAETDAAARREALLKPLGPEDAEVTIHVLTRDATDLERVLRPMMEAIASEYEGHVRVEFPEPNSDEYNRLVEDVAQGVPSGLIINGEMIKEVPEAGLGMLAFQGSPSFAEWGAPEVRLAVEHELEAAGVDFTPRVEHDHPDQTGPGDDAGDGHAGHSH